MDPDALLLMVKCPVCSIQVPERSINVHLDSGCTTDGSSQFSLSKKGKGKALKASTSSTKDLAPIFAATSKQSQSAKHPPSSSPRPIPSNNLISSLSKKRSATEAFVAHTPSTKRSKITASHLHTAPLAEKLRPGALSDFVGQPHLTGPDSLLMSTLASGSLGSMIFWGPPGCGKTTLARLLATSSDAVFKELSATVVGINDVRAVFEDAKRTLALTGRQTILFLDEVHRFNKAQQDIFLPFVEQGHIQLIGATTENPSFKLTSALLSRCRVFVLERLTDNDVEAIILNALQRVSSDQPTTPGSPLDLEEESTPSSQPVEQTMSQSSTIVPSQPSPSSLDTREFLSSTYPQFTHKILASIVSLSSGDARTALSLVEMVLTSPTNSSEATLLSSLRRSVSASYDRTGEGHYDMISALHKSVRGSQGSAALYWLARMLTAGEDPMYVARRMVVCASEDIGLADNHALPLAMATLQACQVIGMPECRINLAHLVAYLSEAPKSTRSYEAYKRAEEAAKLNLTAPVPLAMRNAPTDLMKELGYARGYNYQPDFAHPVHNDYLPISFRDEVFLREPGDLDGKTWDEDALRIWEREENGGRDWEGRSKRY